MSVIYVLLVISISVALLFFVAFLIAVNMGQYDDTYTPAVRMLFEDELVKENQEKKNNLDQTRESEIKENYQL